MHGLDLPSVQSRSTANNENFKINTGKSWCWDGAAVDFKFIPNKEENNRNSVKFMRGWDLISRSLDSAVKILGLTSAVEKVSSAKKKSCVLVGRLGPPTHPVTGH